MSQKFSENFVVNVGKFFEKFSKKYARILGKIV